MSKLRNNSIGAVAIVTMGAMVAPARASESSATLSTGR